MRKLRFFIIVNILFTHLSIGLVWSSFEILNKIQKLEPVHPFNGRIGALEVLGYDIIREQGEGIVSDTIKQTIPFMRGEKFELILYLVRKYRGNIDEMFIRLKVNSIVVGTESVNIHRTQMGEILKLSIPAWIPWSLIGNKAVVKLVAQSNTKIPIGPSIDIFKISISGEVKQSKQNHYKAIPDNLFPDWKSSMSQSNKTASTIAPVPSLFDQVIAALDYGIYLSLPCSLRIHFQKESDVNYFFTLAQIKVKPNTRYVISYHLRTEEITSESGPRLEIYDVDRGYNYWIFSTKDLIGTNDWTKVESDFLTARETKSIIVRVRRYGREPLSKDAVSFGKISGVAWFDCFVLKEI